MNLKTNSLMWPVLCAVTGFTLIAGSVLGQCGSCAKPLLGFRGNYCAGGTFSISLVAETTGNLTANGNGCGAWTPTAQAKVRMKPFKAYTLTSEGTQVATAHIDFDVPAGYRLFVDGVERNSIDLTNLGCAGWTDFWEVELRGCGGNEEAGESSGPQLGSVHWSVGLGKLSNGESAGSVHLFEDEITAAIYTPSPLYYSDSSDEVEVIKTGSVLRQIKAPQAFADIVTISSTEYEVRMYRPDQVGALSGGFYALDGSAFKTWRVRNPDAPSATATRVELSEISNAETVTTLIEHAGATWSLNRGAGLVRETHLRTGNIKTITLLNADNTVASKRDEYYTTFAWGEEVTMEVIDPDGSPQTTTREYFTDAAQPHSYGKLKWVVRPDGSWERYEYSSATSDFGRKIRVFRPWLNLPATPDLATESNCRCTMIEYTSRGGSVFSNVAGWEQEVILGVSRWDEFKVYFLGSSGPGSSETSVEELTQYSGLFGSMFSSRAVYSAFSTVPSPEWLRGRTAWEEMANGTSRTHAYEQGVFDLATRTFTAGTGVSVRSQETWGTLWQWEGVEGKTIRQITVIDALARTAFVETQVYIGMSNYEPVSRTDYFYDGSSTRISLVEKDGRIAEEKSWDGDRLLSQTDEAGITTTYGGFDELGRATTMTRAGVVTTTTFDALGRARVVTQTGGGLTLTQSTDYDVAGRITEQTDVNGLTTSYAYSANGRITTVTHPNGSTTITEKYLDGQVKSITGTAVVPEFYHYTVDGTTGFITTRVYQGADLSDRWRETTTDWAGNTVEENRPGQSSELITAHEYNSAGQRSGTVTSGAAPRRFEYDELGEPLRQGLDVDVDGLLTPASLDRMEESTTVYALDTGAWYEVSTRKTWLTNNSATSTTLQTTKRKLTGLSATTLSDVTSIDDQNQLTRVVETVNRATATVTRTTTYPGVSNVGIEISTNGRLMSRQMPGANAAVTFEYDGLGRLWKTTDPRTSSVVETRSYHAGTDQLASIATPAGTTLYSWYAPLHANAGQLEATTKPDNTVVRQSYNARGQRVRTWGGGTYPVEWTFDGYGQMTAMRTYRAEQGWDGASWPATVTGGDLTQWHYHEASGLLESKEDAEGESVSYNRAITLTGSTQTRTWARTPGAAALTTTWTYDLAGNLTGITYSDATPPVSITADRAGRPSAITDAAGTREVTHNASGQLTGENYTAGIMNGLTFARGHDAQSRLDELSWTAGATSLVSQSYTYSAATGRLDTAVDGLVNVTNRYVANSDLDQGPEFRHNGTLRMTTTRTHDAAGRLESIASTQPGLSAHSGTAYEFDAASRRKKATHADGTAWDFGYNDRGELNNAGRKWPNGLQVSGQQFAQEYDAIGNLITTTTNGRAATYTPNPLNQYTDRTVPAAIDIIGSSEPTATVTVNQAPATRNQGGYFFAPVPADNSANAVWKEIRILGVKNNAGPSNEDAVTEQNGHRFLPKTPETFTNDEDGNLTRDGRWDYTWDAENRLIKMETRSDGPLSMPRHRIENTYDFKHRRVRKVVKLLDVPTSTWNVQSDTRFLYDGGWNLLAEINATGDILRSYLWGKDLSGTFTGAGGVGGLLAIHIHTALDTTNAGTYFPAFDGNGNVLSLTKATDGTQAASYEYSPFGELLRTTGPAAKFNAIRFSTKYEDLETGLNYFGYRFYSSAMKRWLNRDPLGEEGGLNLYGMVGNDPVNRVDYLGLADVKTEKRDCGWWIVAGHSWEVMPWIRNNGLTPPGDRYCAVSCNSNSKNEKLVEQGRGINNTPGVDRYLYPDPVNGPSKKDKDGKPKYPPFDPSKDGDAMDTLFAAISNAESKAIADCKNPDTCCKSIEIKVHCTGEGNPSFRDYAPRNSLPGKNPCNYRNTLDCKTGTWSAARINTYQTLNPNGQ